MLYDRPYMRDSGEPESNKASMVMTLLVVTVAVFVLQMVLNVFFPGVGGRSNRFLSEWFALSGQNFRELKVWTILSYAFLHSTVSIWHIVFNMAGLFFIGRVVEPVLGRERFLTLYLGSAFIGGVIYLLLHVGGINYVVGASGAVFGLLTFFCMLRPEQPITFLLFMVLPVTLKPKWVFWGMIGISIFSLLFYELPGRSGMAHSAHLGGILAGIIFFRYVYSANPYGTKRASREKPAVELPEWFKRKKDGKRKFSYKVNRSNRDHLQKEVDRILDKINTSGFGSLSDEEKTTLDRAKDILSK